MAGRLGGIAPQGRTPLQHGMGFLISGGLAFCVDASVLEILTRVFGIHPILARFVAISTAMVAGWLAHRTLTFAVRVPPSVLEFMRYAGVAWSAAAINYGIFVVIMLARPSTDPLLAMITSSAGATTFAYLGMRFAAFRVRARGPRP
jgi:putative flippase GtrA